MKISKQQFVQYYCGSLTDTLKLMNADGINICLKTLQRWMKEKEIISALKKKVEPTFEQSKGIGTRTDRQKFWTEVYEDVDQRMSDRLRAAELLGKSEADFTEKIEHSGNLDLAAKILIARKRKK